MTEQIEQAGGAFGKAIADELRSIRADMATKDDLRALESSMRADMRAELREAVREIIDVVNGNTLALREDLNRQFERAGLPVKLDTAPRKKAQP